jgi:hypothetical protein
MLYAFTDESYSSRFYFQGALIVYENELFAIENLVGEILLFATKLGVHPDTEIHGHSIMNSVHGWESLDRKFGLKIRILKNLFNGITNTNSQLLVAGIFTGPFSSPVASTRNRHIHTHDLLLGMIDQYAMSLNQKVLVYSDKTSVEKHLLANFEINRRKYENLRELEFIDSRTSAGIQLVDSCLYIFHRMSSLDKEKKSRNYELSELWTIVQRLIHEDFEPMIIGLESTEDSQ